MLMESIVNVLIMLGGVAVFMLGLETSSVSVANLTQGKLKTVIQRCSSNRFRGALFGAAVTAICQSSVAVNYIAVEMVSRGIISFFKASAVIVGANVGTTITAQLIALSGSSPFDVTAIGSLIAFVGFFVKSSSNGKVKEIGNVMVGLGFVFIGLNIISISVDGLKDVTWFINLFVTGNKFLSLLNGIVLAGTMQSSSAVTGILVLLSAKGMLNFSDATFMVLGANLGSCIPVVIASLNKSLQAFRTSIFNLVFNLFGIILFFIPLYFYGEKIGLFFDAFSYGAQSSVANFHTGFNLVVGLAILPVLKPFTSFIEVLTEKPRLVYLKLAKTSKR